MYPSTLTQSLWSKVKGEFGELCLPRLWKQIGAGWDRGTNSTNLLRGLAKSVKPKVFEIYINLGKFIRIQIVRPVSSLIVVDVQNDFISGSLAISNCPAGHDGYEVSLKLSWHTCWLSLFNQAIFWGFAVAGFEHLATFETPDCKKPSQQVNLSNGNSNLQWLKHN